MKASEMKLDRLPESPTTEPYYDLIDSGSYSADEFSSDPETQKLIVESVAVISQLAALLEDNGLIL